MVGFPRIRFSGVYLWQQGVIAGVRTCSWFAYGLKKQKMAKWSGTARCRGPQVGSGVTSEAGPGLQKRCWSCVIARARKSLLAFQQEMKMPKTKPTYLP